MLHADAPQIWEWSAFCAFVKVSVAVHACMFFCTFAWMRVYSCMWCPRLQPWRAAQEGCFSLGKSRPKPRAYSGSATATCSIKPTSQPEPVRARRYTEGLCARGWETCSCALVKYVKESSSRTRVHRGGEERRDTVSICLSGSRGGVIHRVDKTKEVLIN